MTTSMGGGSFRRRLSRAARNREWTWRHVLNREPTRAYRGEHWPLTNNEQRIVTDLNEKGIAFSSVTDILGSTALFDALVAAVWAEESRRQEEIVAARGHADGAASIGQKTFLLELLGHKPVLDPESVFGRFALARPFIAIANGYFGMLTRLRYYNVWHTFPTATEARESQLWHRDREDFLILKVFVYLARIDEGAGPFTYVPGSHHKGEVRREPSFSLEGGVRRSTDDQMAVVAPPSSWITAVGRSGTVVFADTRGYHRGGLARLGDRVMFVSMFTSSASQSEELLQRPAGIALHLDRELAFALGSGPARVGESLQ